MRAKEREDREASRETCCEVRFLYPCRAFPGQNSVQGLLQTEGKRDSLGASIVLLYQAFVHPSIHVDKICPIPCTCCRPCMLFKKKKMHVARMTVTKQVPTVGTCNGLLVPTDELTLAALVAITGSWCCSGGRPRCIRLKGVHVQRLQSFSLVELLPPSWAHTVGLGRLLWRLLQLSVYVSWAHSVCLHFRTSALTLAGLVIGRSPEPAREAVVVRMVVPGASVWKVSMYNG